MERVSPFLSMDGQARGYKYPHDAADICVCDAGAQMYISVCRGSRRSGGEGERMEVAGAGDRPLNVEERVR